MVLVPGHARMADREVVEGARACDRGARTRRTEPARPWTRLGRTAQSTGGSRPRSRRQGVPRPSRGWPPRRGRERVLHDRQPRLARSCRAGPGRLGSGAQVLVRPSWRGCWLAESTIRPSRCGRTRSRRWSLWEISIWPALSRALRTPRPPATERMGHRGAARCRGLLAAAEGDFPDAIAAAIERSLAALDGYPYSFERSRALLTLGSVQRRAQQRVPHGPAGAGARHLRGARRAPLGRQARSELTRISGRRPAARVDRHRAPGGCARGTGSRNREIAAELFMAVSTVEAHLSRLPQAGRPPSRLATRLVNVSDQGPTVWRARVNPRVFLVSALRPRGASSTPWSTSSSVTFPAFPQCEPPPWPVPAHASAYETSHRRRYLGSTIVLSDEACVCISAASPEAVAKANRRAGLTFDRIVPAVTVAPTTGGPR